MSGPVSEYDHEPVRGLPGDLPEGETILWQGSPDWRTFARSALHTRWIAGYFAAMALFAIASGSMAGLVAMTVGGALCLALLALFAVMVARTTVYTITNRRVVLRVGVALNKCFNLPLKHIGAANLRPQAAGHGDISLVLAGKHRLGYAVLWPHVRPLRFSQPEPMLRALPDAAATAELLARACAAVTPNQRGEETASQPSQLRGLKEAAA